MPAVQMLHETNPKDDLLKRVGDISGLQLFSNDVAVAIYTRPQRTKSGLYLTDTTRGEDVYQGKVGLIIKMGSLAFQDDDKTTFNDAERCEVGDFVVFRPADGWMLTLNNGASNENKVLIRVLHDTSIRGRVSDPDLVY
jgi:co-chaperonin GroES (HSP10)